MAARTVKIRHDDETRAKIQTSQLLNRLNDHVFGEGDQKVEISQTQMKAIEILLRKSLPDLTAVEVSGDADNPLEHVIRWKSSTSSTTLPDSSSKPSTTEPSASPASSAIDALGRPSPLSTIFKGEP